jgi:ribosome maturation factor RimP
VFEKEKIVELTQTKLSAFEAFLVDVVISPGNKIVIEIDSPQGISIGQCAELNRFLNAELDNEANEFELTVSSPGLEKPFKVYDQYKKNIDRQIKVRTVEGKEFEAKLKEVNENGILLHQRTKEKNEKNKKEWVEKDIQLPFSQIKETRVILTFK